MRKFKLTLYAITLVYMAIATVICLMAWNYKTSWSREARNFFDIGIVESFKGLVLSNLIGVCLLVVIWGIEHIHIWQLRIRNKRQAQQFTELKAKLYEKYEAEIEQQPTEETETTSDTHQKESEKVPSAEISTEEESP